MGGFRDLLALLLGWKSTTPGTEPPYRTVARQVWHTGAAVGGHHVTGQRAGQALITGRVAGQIHG
jgi:hypothetical protein